MQKSNEELLIMGYSMCNTAKEIVKSSILNNNPGISNEDLRREIILRFYGDELDYDQIVKE